MATWVCNGVGNRPPMAMVVDALTSCGPDTVHVTSGSPPPSPENGSLGAVIILLLWFYMTGAAILVGGKVNAEIEHAAAEHGAPEAKLPGEKSPT